MGFLTGFGTGLQRSAELEQQAQIAKQQDLTKANLDLARLLIDSDDPEQQAQGLAIMSDPSHPHRTDKAHPNIQVGRNLLQALGTGAGSQSVASGQSPAGMAGMLAPSASPLVQSGVGTLGDQGSGEPLPPPPVGAPPPGNQPSLPSPPPPAPLPPQPAAMTTNPPATQGGKISALAAAPAAGAPPPAPPPQIAPAPPPPAPPSQVAQMLSQYESSLQTPTGISLEAHKERRAEVAALARARALKAGGASDEVIQNVLGGTQATSTSNTQTRTASSEKVAGERIKSQEEVNRLRLEAAQKATEARIAESKARREQDWAKHRENLSLSQQRLAKSGTGPGNSRVEDARMAKLQEKGRAITNFADNGIAGVENLRGMYQLFLDAKERGDKIEAGVAWKRFVHIAGGEANRITAAMTGPDVKGVRMGEARTRAAIKEITTAEGESWLGALGYPPIPTLRPEEVNLRLDNIRDLVEQSEKMSRAVIEADALNPPKAGKNPLSPIPDRARAGEKPPETPAPVQTAAKTIPRAKVQEVADHKKITYEEARKAAEAEGFKIQ